MSRMPLPEPEAIAARLRGTDYARQIERIAQNILERRIALLGYEIRPKGEIHWRRDYVHDRETPPMYFRRIPYLDFARAGDHKIIWELNRHQHLAAMTQAWVLTGRGEFLDDVFAQLASWLEQNPVSRGINWASALEVAFRALSWIWIHHLAGAKMPAPFAAKWRCALYHHGCFLERNLSLYFSPNTHLQGEALALHALGLLFGIERWRGAGAHLMRGMIGDHLHPDGGHFEQSSYYHVYATDMFLFHAVLERPGDPYLERLRKMARYLFAIGSAGDIPLLGDDDGGRLFHPYGERRRFGRATLAAAAAFLGDTPTPGDAGDLNEIAVWWMGDRALSQAGATAESQLFPDTGTTTLIDGDINMTVSVNAFGRGSAGHSHAHALHFTLRRGAEDVLVDPGTYTYISDPAWRDRFRGTAAHNTVRIDGRDQADPAGPFRWSNVPKMEILEWQAQPWKLRASCAYRGVRHERRIFYQDGAIWVLDEISGAGRHRVEQFWHPAGAVERDSDGSIRLAAGFRLIVAGARSMDIQEGGEFGWISPVPGVKHASMVICAAIESELPCRLAAVFDLRGGIDRLVMEAGRLILGDRVVIL